MPSTWPPCWARRRSACSAICAIRASGPTTSPTPIDRLIDLAGRFDVTAEMENEPVCNVGSVAELAASSATRRQLARCTMHASCLRPLVDIGNSWSMGQPPTRRRHRAAWRRWSTYPSQGPRLRRPSAPCRWATATCRGPRELKRLLDDVDGARGDGQHGDPLPAGRPQCHSPFGGCPEKNCGRDRRRDRLEAAPCAPSPSSPSTSSPTAASAAIRSPSFPTRAA